MWKGGYWKKYSNGIILEGNGVSQLRKVYEDIASICRLSHAMVAVVLPDYDRLSPNDNYYSGVPRTVPPIFAYAPLGRRQSSQILYPPLLRFEWVNPQACSL